MRYIFASIFLCLLIVSSTYSQAAKSNMNCQLIEKKLNLINSQLEVVIEKYKIFFKTKILPQMKSQDGKPAQIKIGKDNGFVKAMSNLSVASATYEALKEACNENSLAPTNKVEDDFSATLIPNTPGKE